MCFLMMGGDTIQIFLKICDIYENSHVGLLKQETRSFYFLFALKQIAGKALS